MKKYYLLSIFVLFITNVSCGASNRSNKQQATMGDSVSIISNDLPLNIQKEEWKLKQITENEYDVLYSNESHIELQKNSKYFNETTDGLVIFLSSGKMAYENNLNEGSDYKKYVYNGFIPLAGVHLYSELLYESARYFAINYISGKEVEVFGGCVFNITGSLFASYSDLIEIEGLRNGVQIWNVENNEFAKLGEYEFNAGKPDDIKWGKGGLTFKKHFEDGSISCFFIGKPIAIDENATHLCAEPTSQNGREITLEDVDGVKHIYIVDNDEKYEILKPELKYTKEGKVTLETIENYCYLTIIRGAIGDIIHISGEPIDGGMPSFAGFYDFRGNLLSYGYYVRVSVMEMETVSEWGSIDEITEKYKISDIDKQFGNPDIIQIEVGLW